MNIGELKPRHSRGYYAPILTKPEVDNCFSMKSNRARFFYNHLCLYLYTSLGTDHYKSDEGNQIKWLQGIKRERNHAKKKAIKLFMFTCIINLSQTEGQQFISVQVLFASQTWYFVKYMRDWATCGGRKIGKYTPLCFHCLLFSLFLFAIVKPGTLDKYWARVKLPVVERN